MSKIPIITMVLILTVAAIGCQTTGGKEEDASLAAAPASIFRPITYVSGVQQNSGRYPDLFSKDSFAVWVGAQVAALKHAQAADANEALVDDAAAIGRNYLVFECHMESVFADMSIAYDVVGFRGMEVYLELPDGTRIDPVQTVIGTPITEKQQGALKLFGRTNLVVFPRKDIWRGNPTVSAGAHSVRLVMAGHNSEFYFEWPEDPRPAPETTLLTWSPSDYEAVQVMKVRFTDLYGKIRKLAHIVD